MTKIELLKTWNRRVWSQQDRTAISDLMAADCVIYGLGKQTLNGPTLFAEFHARLCRLFVNTEVVVLQYMEQDDWLCAICEVRTESTKNGKIFSMSGAMHCRVQDDKFVEAFNQFDFLGLFAQMGLLPEDVLFRGLSGLPLLPPSGQPE